MTDTQARALALYYAAQVSRTPDELTETAEYLRQWLTDEIGECEGNA